MAGEITALIAQLNQYRTSELAEPVRVDIDLLTAALAAILAGTDIAFTGALALTSGQIAFPATQNPSADPNTLDDYEEGTYTPTIGDGAATYTLSTASGWYTKIGNLVTAFFNVVWTAIGAVGAGALRASLPIATGSIRGGGALGTVAGLDTTATLNQIVADLGVSSATIFFQRLNDNAAATSLPANGSSAAGQIVCTAAYQV